MTVITEEIPHVAEDQRVEIQERQHGFYRVIVRYGFMQDPVMAEIMKALEKRGLKLPMMDTTFYLGRDTLIPGRRRGLSRWRKKLFVVLARNAQNATAFFGIPANRVVELGAQIEI
jgi:KUP system potassium uptake protein